MSRKGTQDKHFLFLFLNFDTLLQNASPKIKRDGIIGIKFEAAGLLFLSDVFVAVAVAVVVAEAPYFHLLPYLLTAILNF